MTKQNKAPLKGNLSCSETFSMNQFPEKPKGSPKAVVHYYTTDLYMVSALVSPIHCIHQRLLWDWQSFYWTSKSKKPSYYCPVVNHLRIFKCGTVKPYKSTSHHKWIPCTPSELIQLALPHGSSGNWTYSVSCLHAPLHVTLSSRHPRSWDQRKKAQKTSTHIAAGVDSKQKPSQSSQRGFH